MKSLSDEAYQALHGDVPCLGDATPDIRVLRKQLKHVPTVVDCQESLLYEIVHYKTSPYCRRWGLYDEPRSLEQYLATALFGQASKQRTRSWLPIVLEHGLNLAGLVDAEQIRLKRRSEVPSKRLEC